MTPDETVALARYVRALCPAQRFDEYTPDAWHDLLHRYTRDEARAAAAAVAGRHRLGAVDRRPQPAGRQDAHPGRDQQVQ